MQEVIDLIDKIIQEHKIILGQLRSAGQIANDASALMALDTAKETFMPGRFDQGKGLEKLEGALEVIDHGVEAHFNREETALLAAFEKHGGRALIAALRTLLADHEAIRKRFTHAKRQVAELMGGKLSRPVWDASAHDIRAYITHTHKLFTIHAQSEQKLLRTLRSELSKKMRKQAAEAPSQGHSQKRTGKRQGAG
ncbi:MAG: hemerythrin domain-containing protein [Chloroflexi bacterium]|nr:hemerythrin domain-containing protein [Chloroflexota bacterium]